MYDPDKNSDLIMISIFHKLLRHIECFLFELGDIAVPLRESIECIVTGGN